MDRFLASFTDPWFKAIIVIQDAITEYTHLYFRDRGLLSLNLPMTVGAVTSPMAPGSDSLPVSAEIAGVQTYLADSMQFFLEYGCRLHESGCFYLMPSFRGEASDASHLAQFYHCEAEIVGDFDAVVTMVEEFLLGLSAHLLSRVSSAGLLAHTNWSHVEELLARGRAFHRVSYHEALKLLASDPDAVRWAPNGTPMLTRTGEQAIIAHSGGPVWLINPPSSITPFYQARATGDVSTCLCGDLLLGLGEVVGAGERHMSKDQLIRSLAEQSVSTAGYEWYVAMKERYPLRTSGFGMGVERYMAWFLGVNDIRNCELIPRRNSVNLHP